MPDDTDIATTELIPVTALSASPTTIVSRVVQLNLRGASNLSIQTIFNENTGLGEDLVATVLVEVSNDPRARPTASAADQAAAQWEDVVVDLGLTVKDVVAAAGSVMDIFSSFTVAYFRQTITRSAGDGDVRSNIAGHD